MVKQLINTGTVPNDGTGDDLRSGAQKINENATELYDRLGALETAAIRSDASAIAGATVIRNIIAISQADYDALVAAGAVDAQTHYLIVEPA
ncbi:hypothetical protein [Profundibacterium mesophilum]|uniref:Baseplate wedge subunit and tail pin n=1 Tax=Profundibacterium mesophilum KAUST100406-0324 TaxID=1037889 RepID=A0A921NXU8_9RHOB|nr:hypothetical protein [Profundibacterium mesophilum]KAF0676719.1 baseplate wedge subunit and tail pin [Profundibacterium mesophilum KAUST100406-0324]